jgi:hypothetical protein
MRPDVRDSNMEQICAYCPTISDFLTPFSSFALCQLLLLIPSHHLMATKPLYGREPGLKVIQLHNPNLSARK